MRVQVRTGEECPKWDPYSFQEIVVERGECTITLHVGLAEWCTVERAGCLAAQASTAAASEALFLAATGLTAKQAERAYRRRRSRCKCGWRKFRWERGFPGEMLSLCERCGRVCDTTFYVRKIQ